MRREHVLHACAVLPRDTMKPAVTGDLRFVQVYFTQLFVYLAVSGWNRASQGSG